MIRLARKTGEHNMNVSTILKHKGSSVVTSTPSAKLSDIVRILTVASLFVIIDDAATLGCGNANHQIKIMLFSKL